MIHLNAESWNIHQLCVLEVLNEKETVPARKAENWLKCSNIISIEPVEALSQQRIRAELKVEVKIVATFHDFFMTQNEKD